MLRDARGPNNIHWWFYGHVGCQYVGMGLFIASFVIAFVKLDVESYGSKGEAHRSIGIAVMSAAGAQVGGASH